MTLGTTLISATPPMPLVSPDWGIAIAILVVGLGAVWKWAQAKDTSEDALHNARLLDYQARERISAEREAALRGQLVLNDKAIADLSELYRSLLVELQDLRRSQNSADKHTRERLGAVQREGAIVMADARRQYQDLCDRIVKLTAAIERLVGEKAL